MEHICLVCLTDSHLRTILAKLEDTCDCCHGAGPTVSLFSVAQECDRVIEDHFEPTHRHDAVVYFDYRPAGTDLRSTLEMLKVVQPQALDALADNVVAYWSDGYTQGTKYSDEHDLEEPHFRLRSDLGASVSEVWLSARQSLKEEARYLNPKVSEFLDHILGAVHTDKTIEGASVVTEVLLGSDLGRLRRARTFQSEAPLVEALEHPERLLGTPAPGIGSAGRMNAKGQPTFYGATSEQVAISEVRPPVGSRVVTAEFTITRPVLLLDLRRLARVQLHPLLSLFHPESLALARRRDFLTDLVRELTMPAMPESEDRDYLLTQVVADYLATHRHGPLDGIIYPSKQRPALNPMLQTSERESDAFNVALFPRASRVKNAEGENTNSAKLWEYEEDNRYLNPTLIPLSEMTRGMASRFNPPASSDKRPVTLELVPESIRVHEVHGIEISTISRSVAVQKHRSS